MPAMPDHAPPPSVSIERSRRPAQLLLAAAVLLAVAAAWLAVHRGAGAATGSAALAALICGGFGMQRWRDRSPALVIDALGIDDRVSGARAGRIPWADVRGLAVLNVRHDYRLVVQLAEPARYLDRLSAARRALAQADLRLCGSPVAIAARSLQIDFAELLTLAHAHRAGAAGA